MIKSFIFQFSPDAQTIDVQVLLVDSTGANTGCNVVPLTVAITDTGATIDSQVVAAVNAYCTRQSIPNPDSWEWITTTPEMVATQIAAAIAASVPSGLVHAPQAAVANCPADATTNYNVVTTILGSLTSAVNTANTKQNQIATQVNSLLAELRTLGLIST